MVERIATQFWIVWLMRAGGLTFSDRHQRSGLADQVISVYKDAKNNDVFMRHLTNNKTGRRLGVVLL